MNRLNILKELRDVVEREGIIQEKYIGDGQYCVIGHLARITYPPFLEMVSDPAMNKKKIAQFTLEDETEKVIDGLVEHSKLRIGELSFLQLLNDEGGQKQVLTGIDKLIQKEMESSNR
ncbi:hypothetical protein [Laceyella putida]|uniref:Uncharacterized protein n=1 Tax=Laceyella putida TaxID=110101 RepID=A0ABW2RRS3_9BACL